MCTNDEVFDIQRAKNDSISEEHKKAIAGQRPQCYYWFIEKDGEAKQIPEEVLKYKIENNEISGDTLAVNEEIKNWAPLKETLLWKKSRPDIGNDHIDGCKQELLVNKWYCNHCGNLIDHYPCSYCKYNDTETEKTPLPPRMNNSFATKQNKGNALYAIFIAISIIVPLVFFGVSNGNTTKSNNSKSRNSTSGVDHNKCIHVGYADPQVGTSPYYKTPRYGCKALFLGSNGYHFH